MDLKFEYILKFCSQIGDDIHARMKQFSLLKALAALRAARGLFYLSHRVRGDRAQGAVLYEGPGPQPCRSEPVLPTCLGTGGHPDRIYTYIYIKV